MPQIILKERTAHLASYAFFTRDDDQYKNTSLSQLYQPPRISFSQNTYHQYVHHVNIEKFLRTTFSQNTSQKQPPEVFCGKKCSQKFHKIHRKVPVPELHFQQSCRPQALAQVFSCEFCEISRNTFFTERLWTTASDLQKQLFADIFQNRCS